MILSQLTVQTVCCSLLLIAFILLLIRRRARTPEWRVALILSSVVLTSFALFTHISYEYNAPLDIIIALLLIEIGICARIYDTQRTFRSIAGTLRNAGNLYIFAGVVCLLSRYSNCPVILWAIPVLLFALGYFFLRREHALANICKGLGVLVSVSFIASAVYDIHEETILPSRKAKTIPARFLPDIVKPSIVDTLNRLNEKVTVLERERRSLAAELNSMKKDRDRVAVLLESERAARGEAERAMAACGEALAAARAERNELKSGAVEEKAAPEILEEIPAQVPTPPPAPSGEEIQSLKQQLKDKETQCADIAREVVRLKEAIDKIRESLEKAAARSRQ